MTKRTLEEDLRDLFQPLETQVAPRAVRAMVEAIPDRYLEAAWHRRLRPRATLLLVAAVLVGALAATALLAGGASSPRDSMVSSAPPSPIAHRSLSSLIASIGNPAWVELGPIEAEAPYAAGLLDNSAHLELMDGFRPVGVNGGRVASLLEAPTGLGDELVVQDVASGRTIVQHASGVYGNSFGRSFGGAILGPSTLYFTEVLKGGSGATGVTALDLATGATTVLIPPDVPRLRTMVLSPSGATLASEQVAVASDGTRRVDVISFPSGAVSRFNVRGNIELATDRVLISSDSAVLYAYDAASGTLAWSRPDTSLVRGYVTTDGAQLIVQLVMSGRSGIWSVNTETGGIRELAVTPTTEAPAYLWAQLSGDHAAILLPASATGALVPQAGFLAGNGVLRASVLDLETGDVTAGALTLTQH